MSYFEYLDNANSRTQDVVNARLCRITPKADVANPNARRQNDANRVGVVVECIFEYNSIEFGMELGVRKSYREANDLRNVSVGRQPHVSIDRRFFPDKDKEPRQGDLFELMLADGVTPDPKFPVFEVMDNQRDGLARFEMRLVQLGSQG